MPEQIQAEPCTHACSYGCGRKYDAILIQVVDASTLMLCMPCLMSLSHQIMKSMVEAGDPGVTEAIAGADFTNIAYVDSSMSADATATVNANPPEDEFAFDGTVSE